MRKAIVFGFLLCIPFCVQPQSLPPLTAWSDLTSDTKSRPLVVINNNSQIVATCQTKQRDWKVLPKAEDYYDCKLEGSHTLTELIQGVLRNDWAMQKDCEQERKRILDEWGKYIDQELKLLKPDKKKKS